MTQPNPEQLAQFQQQVVAVAAQLTEIAQNAEPHIAVMALLSTAATAAQATRFTRDQLLAVLTETYDRTQATMAELGIRPGEAPPPGTQERIEAMIRQRQGG